MGILHKTMRSIAGILLLVINCSLFCGADPIEAPVEEVQYDRDGKALPVFQVVKFPNDVCAGGTRNGTCYTAEECSTKGGTSDGSCASGFGVCCTFALACGGSSSENQTYIIQASATTFATNPCTYSICPCSTNICRIRYDFDTFVIAQPTQGTTSGTSVITMNDAIGDCTTDQMFISSGSGAGSSPVICGTNTKYHMIIDNPPGDTDCQTVNFNLGGDTTVSRSWSIRVTQYACGDTDSSGWPGCLQYYTSTANNIQSFNFPAEATTLTQSATHLQNQEYDICIRRGSGFCWICYSEAHQALPADANIDQVSFGVSISPDIAIKSRVGTLCTDDWIEIPGANSDAIATIQAATGVATATDVQRLCGRVFAPTNAAAASDTICTRTLPFRVGVNFNDNEVGTNAADAMAGTSEQSVFPGGIIGFQLTYWQMPC